MKDLCRMLLATKWACEYCSSYHGWRAMLISLEASKLCIVFNIWQPQYNYSQPQPAAAPAMMIGAIGAYIYSPDPLHHPKISRNVINWILNELISSGIQFGHLGNWTIFFTQAHAGDKIVAYMAAILFCMVAILFCMYGSEPKT